MEPGAATALLWLLFGGTHVFLTLRVIRNPLVRALGQWGFVGLYSVIASVCFAALVHYVSLHRFEDAEGILFSSLPPVQGALLLVSVFGFTLIIAGVMRYPGLPLVTGRSQTAPRGIQQITRHPFFSGIGLWAGAHVLLSNAPATCVFFLGFIVLAVFGGLHQDRKLASELGDPYRDYLSRTSFIPFLAALRGKTRIRLREQPWFAYAVGLAASLGLREVHEHIFDHGGAWIIGTVVGGALIATVNSARRKPKPKQGEPNVGTSSDSPVEARN